MTTSKQDQLAKLHAQLGRLQDRQNKYEQDIVEIEVEIEELERDLNAQDYSDALPTHLYQQGYWLIARDGESSFTLVKARRLVGDWLDGDWDDVRTLPSNTCLGDLMEVEVTP